MIPRLHDASHLRIGRLAAVALAGWLAFGCATAPEVVPAPLQRPLPPDTPLARDAAVQALAADLVHQLRASSAAAAEGRDPAIAVDAFIDAANGWPARATQQLQDLLIGRLAQGLPGLRLAPLSAGELPRARYLMVGSVSTEARQAQPTFRLAVAAIDLSSGRVAAQSSAWIADRDLDMTPQSAWQDSPLFPNDAATRGLISTTRAAAGTPADAAWLAQLPAQAALLDALHASSADARGALSQAVRVAAGSPRAVRTLSAIYMQQLRAGNAAEAERTFGELVAAAFAEGNLSIRLLFAVNSTAFMEEARLGQQYRIWMRQLALHVARSRQCVEVLGHSSRSGEEGYNEQLSLARADAVRRLLGQHAPAARDLVRVTGRGFRENIVGTGSDDARDAIDRRVEFRIVPCAARRAE